MRRSSPILWGGGYARLSGGTVQNDTERPSLVSKAPTPSDVFSNDKPSRAIPVDYSELETADRRDQQKAIHLRQVFLNNKFGTSLLFISVLCGTINDPTRWATADQPADWKPQ